MNYKLNPRIENQDFDVLLLKGLEDHTLLKAYVEHIRIKFLFEKNKEIKTIIKYIFMDNSNNFID